MSCILYSVASALSQMSFHNLWHEQSFLDSAYLSVVCRYMHSIAHITSALLVKAALQHSLGLGLFYMGHQTYELTGLGSCSTSS